nr:PREDICTED: uncharacterized protein LOC108221512 [Daucus carota subsp. sativus]
MSSKKLLNPSKDDKPLWLHVEVLDAPIGGGGNRKWRCRYCNKIVTGSYSKVRAHLLKISNMGVEACKGISDDVYRQIEAEHKRAEEKVAKEAMNVRQRNQCMAYQGGSDLVQPKKRKGALELAFNVADRDEIDKDCAMMFYTGGISFNFARNPFFRNYSLKLANSNVAGYTPPTYNRLRTTLLSQQKQHVQRLVQPVKDSWKKKGASICSDGWCDRQQKPLINIMVASAAGPMFLKSVNASQVKVKDAEYIAALFMEIVEEIGPEHVVQIVTDNASNYKAAGALIETKYPRIFWTPCVVHSNVIIFVTGLLLNFVLTSFLEIWIWSLEFVHWQRL